MRTDHTLASADSESLRHLMAGIKKDSSIALGRLMDVCWPELVRYATRQLEDAELARDLVQEVFIRVWERRHEWVPKGSVRAYLYQILRRLVIDEQRKLTIRRRWQKRVALAGTSRPATPAEELEARILADRFEAAVASLPTRRREVFELVFQRGLTHAETAAVMDISVQTVANQMSAALRTVRQAIKEN